ncbi:MAG TPA: 3-dehydro-L-gulonate 2-dehydrogenase [Terracidiphilus sp.]|nr:3-dehydro-L-gulonate 2-dehydrogenase [Terracidiphilus sp.]
MLRIPFHDVLARLAAILQTLRFSPARAHACARLFAETTRDGVYSHGVNRFPRFVATIRNGSVDPVAEPARLARFGALERWNGRLGPGNLNAQAAMDRAIHLARQHGIAAIALANTNHWMRGGSYGWQAADAGLIALCWTNTMPNLPPWGAVNPAIGNNPLVLAVPRPAGHLVLDMAMSQFSYGALETHRRRNQPLPVPGGFDPAGQLTSDAAAIEQTQRPLPIGYWKGSGLSILLDAIAAITSLGNATHQLATDPFRESALSQTFIALNPAAIGDPALQAQIADDIVAGLHAATPADPAQPVRYPGEQTLRLRAENTAQGLPIEESTWSTISEM